MKTLKTLLSVSFFIVMYLYVQSEEKKAKYPTQPNQYLASRNDSISLKSVQSSSNIHFKTLAIKK